MFTFCIFRSCTCFHLWVHLQRRTLSNNRWAEWMSSRRSISDSRRASLANRCFHFSTVCMNQSLRSDCFRLDVCWSLPNAPRTVSVRTSDEMIRSFWTRLGTRGTWLDLKAFPRIPDLLCLSILIAVLLFVLFVIFKYFNINYFLSLLH